MKPMTKSSTPSLLPIRRGPRPPHPTTFEPQQGQTTGGWRRPCNHSFPLRGRPLSTRSLSTEQPRRRSIDGKTVRTQRDRFLAELPEKFAKSARMGPGSSWKVVTWWEDTGNTTRTNTTQKRWRPPYAALTTLQPPKPMVRHNTTGGPAD